MVVDKIKIVIKGVIRTLESLGEEDFLLHRREPSTTPFLPHISGNTL